MNLAPTLLVFAATIAAAFDLRTRRIPNALCLAVLCAAIILHLQDGAASLALALAAGAAAFLLGSAAFARGWLGGGDVKLVAASCALVGAHDALAFILDVLVAGGLLALAEAARRGRARALVRSALLAGAGAAPSEATPLPYGVAIAAGAFAYALIPFLRFAP